MRVNFRYEGERDGQKRQAIQETIEYILNKQYGETVTHTELGRLLQYNIDSDEEFRKYKSTMNRIKNFIIDYGYVLRSVSGIGYYILKPSQISNHCYKTYIERSENLFNKSQYILEHTEKSQLSEERLEELKNMMELNETIIENMRNTVTTSAYYSRKAYYDNLEN